MDELKFLIVEDNPSTALELEIQIQELGAGIYKIVDNSKDALKCIETGEVDVVIMDVHIKGPKNGIELAASFKKRNLPVLFITSSEDPKLYQKALTLGPIGYLVKPFNRLTLQSTIEVAIQQASRKNRGDNTPESKNSWPNDTIINDAFFIKQNNLLRKIPFDSVLWIKTEGNYSLIYTTDKRYILKLSLKRVLEQLPRKFFVQIQRAYIVALPKIEDIDVARSEVIIQKEKLPLGRNYREELLGRLNILK